MNDFIPDPPIRVRDIPIGCIGAGFIMADVQLAAYAEAGFPVVAIASRTASRAAEVARRWGISRVHETPHALIEDPGVAILDIAFPPDQQPALIRHALKQPHIKGILAQKPLALDAAEAARLVAEARAAGKILSVNQNMRYDQSMRVLRQLLDRDALGAPVLMTIEMRAIPHWQPFLAAYDKLTILNMGIHHLDALRFLLGDPIGISTTARTDPRTQFAHRDGIVVSTMRFASGRPRGVDGGRLERAARARLPVRHLHQVADGRARRRGAGHDRLARLPGRQRLDAALCLAHRDRRRMGRAALDHALVSSGLRGRDGAVAIRGLDRHAAGAGCGR